METMQMSDYVDEKREKFAQIIMARAKEYARENDEEVYRRLTEDEINS